MILGYPHFDRLIYKVIKNLYSCGFSGRSAAPSSIFMTACGAYPRGNSKARQSAYLPGLFTE